MLVYTANIVLFLTTQALTRYSEDYNLQNFHITGGKNNEKSS